MKRILRLCAIACLAGAPATGPAQYIWINVSYKAFLSPENGQPAPYVTTNLIYESIRFENQKLERYGRGYRVRLADPQPIIYIGSGTPTVAPNDPTRWYNHLAGGNVPAGWDFRADTYTNYPAIYHWRPDAVNIFMGLDTNGAGGYCGCKAMPSDPIINMGPQKAGDGFTEGQNFGAHILHETGHYYGLGHTFGDQECPPGGTGAGWTPGDDAIADTLPDVSCWSIDYLSQYHFQRSYAQLTDANQIWLVNNTYSNLMSYHARMGWSLLTEPQLDRWAETANTIRLATVSGRTIFVSTLGDNFNSGLWSDAPKRTLGGIDGAAQAANAGGGDIVLLAPGVYREANPRINRPVTLRATRAGWVTIAKQ
jgi:hypothetical protein